MVLAYLITQSLAILWAWDLSFFQDLEMAESIGTLESSVSGNSSMNCSAIIIDFTLIVGDHLMVDMSRYILPSKSKFFREFITVRGFYD